MPRAGSASEGGDELHLVDRLIGGTFRLRECIASGSSGAVYRADQVALGRTVAVKILRPELALDPRFVTRFHGEALAASRLNHPNTVAVIDYGQTEDGLLYLAMEHLRGRTLTEVARAERPLAPARVVDFVAQIAEGVEEAHSAGVVHADLKPENVVVEHRRGGWDLVKVVDFGIARLLFEPREGDDEAMICGTPEYMAPEVIRGKQPVVASDVYALGAILYELVAGRPPFVGESSVDVLTAHLQDAPPPLSELAPEADILAAVEPVVRRALEKHPDDRYPTAAAFREALLAATGHAKVAAHTALCAGCGTLSDASFKFCPECGRARASSPPTPRPVPQGVVSRPATDAGEPPSLFPLPICGRARALERIRAFARSAGGAILITGPAGTGKSRLVRELWTDASRVDPDTAIYVVTPDPSGLGSAYYPVRAAITAVLDLPELCPYAELERAVLSLGLTSRDLPGLAELLTQRGDLAELETPARMREMIAAARRVLLAAGTRRSTLFVFEDADRYDAPSRRVVADLTERAAEGPVRIALTTSRAASAREDGIVASVRCARIELEPLDAGALLPLVEHVEAQTSLRLPASEELLRLSGGDPAYLSELIRFAVEGGTISEAPANLADLVGLRLEHLPRSALLVAQAIAAYGMEASPAEVEAALDDALERDEQAQGVELLEARGIIEVGDSLRFQRELLRDITYDRTPAQTRRGLHAACYAAREVDDASAAVLGHHAEGAGWHGEAAIWLERAGDAASRELDEAGAAEHYQRALECARVAMLADADDKHRLRFLSISIKLAEVLARERNLHLARGILDEALGHCHAAPGLKAQLLRALGHVHGAAGELGAAAAALRQAIGLGIMSGERELLALLYLDLATYQVEAGRTSEAVFELTEAIDLITAGEGGHSASAPPSFWRLALRLGKLHVERGDRLRALELGRDAERQAQRTGSRLGAARAQAMIAAQLEALGDTNQAARYRARAAEGMRALGDRRGTVELLLSGARLTRRLRRLDPAAIAEARRLSEELDWAEGLERAGETEA